MATYVALLRGVNVGGNPLKMERLRFLCAEIGLQNVRTYVQSGNVVFDGQGPASRWAQILERRLNGEARLPVSVIVKTAAELRGVAAGNPYLSEKGMDATRLYVTFLQEAPAKAALAALDAIIAKTDRFRCVGTEVYLHCPNGYGETKLSNGAIEKKLGIRATTRNWNTVTKLCEMCADR